MLSTADLSCEGACTVDALVLLDTCDPSDHTSTVGDNTFDNTFNANHIVHIYTMQVKLQQQVKPLWKS
jgi:hypothetical protein